MKNCKNFDIAVAEILKHEGGFVNHPNDPGGATNLGITQSTYDNYNRLLGLHLESVRDIDIATAKNVYYVLYWQQNTWLEKLNPVVARAVFDFLINAGAARAARTMQIAYNAYAATCDGTGSKTLLTVDGIVGRKTQEAINGMLPVVFIGFFAAARGGYYYGLSQGNGKLRSFIRGWLRRTFNNEQLEVSV